MLLFSCLRGVVASILAVLFMLFVAFSIVIGGCFICLIPCAKLRSALRKKLLFFQSLWGKLNRFVLLTGLRHKWDIQIPENLSTKQWYLIIANHRSWTDILVLTSLFSSKTPAFKFFYKRELLWQLPVAGLAMWFLRFPHVARYPREKLKKRPDLRQKNIKEIQAACDLLRETPISIVNFAEGTRFSEEKRHNKNSPYQHLLPAKAQGISMVINALSEKLDGILDVDIVYQPTITMWSLLSGRYDKVVVHAHTIATSAELQGDYLTDRDYRRRFRDWINAIWQSKDQRMQTIYATEQRDG